MSRRLLPLALVLVSPAALATESPYIATGTQVRYTVSPPGAGWTARDFDDHAWTAASLPLVGEGRVEAGNSAITAAQRVPKTAMTMFVRVRFRVGAESHRLRSFALRSRFAEGLVAWLDGVEVARRYVSPGAGPEAPSLQVHGPEPESFAIVARGEMTVPGEHVLALEVHAHKPMLGPLCDAELSGFDAIRIIRGPYLMRPGKSEITIAWDTDLDAPGEIRYGETAEYGKSERSALPVRHHALRLRGLAPAKSYHYSVLAGATDSGDATFHTLPQADQPLRFAIYGDTRNGHDIHARLVGELLREDPDFLLTVGDLVDRGSEESDWQHFFAVAGPLLRMVPIVPALGNHDVVRAGEGVAKWLELFPPPPGAPEPGYYSFDAAGVHFAVLDSNQLRSPRQVAWLEADLARAKGARARFVAMHEGPWSSGFHGNNAEAIRAYVPVFQRYGVNLLASGHDHDFERGRIAGLDYIVTGGGGAPLYTPRCGGSRPPCPSSTFLITPEYHYVLVEVQRDNFRVCPKRIDGSPLEPCVDYPLRRPRR
jgi:hypothetical protein